MPNTGKKYYALLVQYSSATGLPTGVVKPNAPGDPDYVPPVFDPMGCPPSGAKVDIRVNNNAAAPIVSDVWMRVVTGSGQGTVTPGNNLTISEPGYAHTVEVVAPNVGAQWGDFSQKVIVDLFVFQDGVLMQAIAIDNETGYEDANGEYIPHAVLLKNLTGNITLNVVSNTRGSYGSGNVLAIQTAANFGNAAFDFRSKRNDMMIPVNAGDQFKSTDFQYYDMPFTATGHNFNDFDLQLKMTTTGGAWVPDENDPDGPMVWVPEVFTYIIPAGAAFDQSLQPASANVDVMIRITKVETAVQTSFRIINSTAAPVVSDVVYTINNQTATIIPGADTSFAVQGGNNTISLNAPSAGNKWGATGQNIGVDYFVFRNEQLIHAASTLGPDVSFSELSGTVVITAASNSKGFYSSGNVMAIQAGDDFGDAYFNVMLSGSYWGDESKMVYEAKQFEHIDFYQGAFSVNGNNYNEYDLFMEIISSNGDWVPADPANPDAGEIFVPYTYTDVIPAGSSYDKPIPANMYAADGLIRFYKYPGATNVTITNNTLAPAQSDVKYLATGKHGSVVPGANVGFSLRGINNSIALLTPNAGNTWGDAGKRIGVDYFLFREGVLKQAVSTLGKTVFFDGLSGTNAITAVSNSSSVAGIDAVVLAMQSSADFGSAAFTITSSADDLGTGESDIINTPDQFEYNNHSASAVFTITGQNNNAFALKIEAISSIGEWQLADPAAPNGAKVFVPLTFTDSVAAGAAYTRNLPVELTLADCTLRISKLDGPLQQGSITVDNRMQTPVVSDITYRLLDDSVTVIPGASSTTAMLLSRNTAVLHAPNAGNRWGADNYFISVNYFVFKDGLLIQAATVTDPYYQVPDLSGNVIIRVESNTKVQNRNNAFVLAMQTTADFGNGAFSVTQTSVTGTETDTLNTPGQFEFINFDNLVSTFTVTGQNNNIYPLKIELWSGADYFTDVIPAKSSYNTTLPAFAISSGILSISKLPPVTSFTINNHSAAPVVSDITYASGDKTGTVIPGGNKSFTMPGENLVMMMDATDAGKQWGSIDNVIAIDFFVFEDGVLTAARTTFGSNIRLSGLSGNVVINASGNSKGFYGNGNVMAIQSAADFGNATFDVVMKGAYRGDETDTINRANQFEYIDFYAYNPVTFTVTGMNRNSYPLKLEAVSADGQWQNGPDGEVFVPYTFTDIIPAGANYTVILPAEVTRRDSFLRISRHEDTDVTTTITIKNSTITPLASPVGYNINGGTAATLDMGNSKRLVVPGSNHTIQLNAPNAGNQWGSFGDDIAIDIFVFRNGILTDAFTTLGDQVTVAGLSGEVLITASSNSKGYYSQAQALAIQSAADFGDAMFQVTNGPQWDYSADTISVPNQVESVPFRMADFKVRGNNNNSYDLKLELTNEEGNTWTDIVPAGSSYNKALPAAYFLGDPVLRISRVYVLPLETSFKIYNFTYDPVFSDIAYTSGSNTGTVTPGEDITFTVTGNDKNIVLNAPGAGQPWGQEGRMTGVSYAVFQEGKLRQTLTTFGDPVTFEHLSGVIEIRAYAHDAATTHNGRSLTVQTDADFGSAYADVTMTIDGVSNNYEVYDTMLYIPYEGTGSIGCTISGANNNDYLLKIEAISNAGSWKLIDPQNAAGGWVYEHYSFTAMIPGGAFTFTLPAGITKADAIVKITRVPVQTTFTIKNQTVAPVLSPVYFETSSHANTLVPGQTITFSEWGTEKSITLKALNGETQWGNPQQFVRVSFFVSQNGRLKYAFSRMKNISSVGALSGQIEVAVISHQSAYGYVGNVLALVTEAGFGAASFVVSATGGYTAVPSQTLNTDNYFGHMDFAGDDTVFTIAGQNNNNYDLQLDIISETGAWSENGATFIPLSFAEVIPAGSSYNLVIPALLMENQQSAILRVSKKEKPLVSTTITLNNNTAAPAISDIAYNVYGRGATVVPGATATFTAPMNINSIVLHAPAAGTKWGETGQNIGVDYFVFKDGALYMALTSMGGDLTIGDLAGNIVINALGNSKGYYSSGNALGIQTAPDFGNATFAIAMTGAYWGDETDTVNTASQFESIDYYGSNVHFNITGQNNNAYNLQLSFITTAGWYDDNWEFHSYAFTEIIPAGAAYSRELSGDSIRQDGIIRISRYWPPNNVQINNKTSAGAKSDVSYLIGNKSDVLKPGSSAQLVTYGPQDFKLQALQASIQGTIDFFVFRNEVLIKASSVKNTDEFTLPALSGDIVINATSNTKGDYRGGLVLAVQSAASFGNATFDVALTGAINGNKTATVHNAGQFEYFDYRGWTVYINISGKNNNSYDLKMQVITPAVRMVQDENGVYQQVALAFTDTIPAGATYQKTLDTYIANDDCIILFYRAE
ncbi:hypothetical protein ACTJJ0_30795 [Chitinophaga sp. 22321]|uniref:Gliding motility-associated C-terminal domain-containing protein n=1 Tax=Chitinophaga hostae TaxID=2831022 RepID=A0ABS5J958_9BACT|nr:hypothetical protein [Chitinophaga hostae]MBS0031615.1 hypothetical protein [Chitinophaga hostae]